MGMTMRSISARGSPSTRALIIFGLFLAAGVLIRWIARDGGASEASAAMERVPMTVVGASMVPIFRDGEVILVTPVSEVCDEIQKGDYVVFRPSKGSGRFVKRIYAAPGDEVLVDSTTQELMVNGEVITNVRGQSFLVKLQEMRALSRFLDDNGRLIDLSYLVLGENSRMVYDSRVFGAISCWMIDGKVHMEE